MREIRPSGSEGGGESSLPYQCRDFFFRLSQVENKISRRGASCHPEPYSKPFHPNGGLSCRSNRVLPTFAPE